MATFGDFRNNLESKVNSDVDSKTIDRAVKIVAAIAVTLFWVALMWMLFNLATFGTLQVWIWSYPVFFFWYVLFLVIHIPAVLLGMKVYRSLRKNKVESVSDPAI